MTVIAIFHKVNEIEKVVLGTTLPKFWDYRTPANILEKK